MRITLLGTGGPRPDPTRQGPATLVHAEGLPLLFDAGRGVATQLVRAGVQVADLAAVFITHHHFDHIGGLGDLLMVAWLQGRAEPLPVYGPRGTVQIVNALFNEVYSRDINFRIAEGIRFDDVMGHPESLIEVNDIEVGGVDVNSRVRVAWDRVEHGSVALDLPDDQWTALGYRVSDRTSTATISGDAVSSPGLLRLADRADLLVMCAYLAADEIDSDGDRDLVEHIIAGAPQAVAIAKDADVGQLVLTHLREKSPSDIERMTAQVEALLPDRVTVGHDLLTIEI